MKAHSNKKKQTNDQVMKKQKMTIDIGIIGILALYMLTNSLHNAYNIILLILISSICFIPHYFGNKSNNSINNVMKCFTFSLQLSFLAILPYKGEPFVKTTLMFIGLSLITTILYLILSSLFGKIYSKKSS